MAPAAAGVNWAGRPSLKHAVCHVHARVGMLAEVQSVKCAVHTDFVEHDRGDVTKIDVMEDGTQ